MKSIISKILQILPWMLFPSVLAIFILVRFPPLIYRDVAYTYDQARDFLMGARIVIDHNPTLIGPTTGMSGVFHGAWWYYVTAFTYLIFGSEPIRYYIVITGVHAVVLLFCVWQISKYFGARYAWWFGTHIAITDYFTNYRIFAGNNIFAAPSFLLYCLATLILFQSSVVSGGWWFLWGIAAGFVAEFELAFGIYLIPITATLCMYLWWKGSMTIKKSMLFGIGLAVPFVPRLLFELRHGFIQTRTLFSFVTAPKLYTPRTSSEVWYERLANFSEYVREAFGTYELAYIGFFCVVLCIMVYILKRNAKMTSMPGVLIYVLSMLFILSLTYKDTFWNYYFEGIQFGFVLLVLISWRYIVMTSHRLLGMLLTCVFCMLLLFRTVSALGRVYYYTPGDSGLKVQEAVVEHIVKAQGEDQIFCVRVYVPPVIPHTYDYLWLHHYLHKRIQTPRQEYINGSCWYIVEPVQKGYEFRVDEWKKIHVPDDARIVESEKTIYGIRIWKMEREMMKKQT